MNDEARNYPDVGDHRIEPEVRLRNKPQNKVSTVKNNVSLDHDPAKQNPRGNKIESFDLTKKSL